MRDNKLKAKKRIGIIIMVCIIPITISLFIMVTRYFGTQINDKYAAEQMSILYNVIPNNVEIIESSNFIGKLDKEDKFSIWVGMIIKTDLSYDEITALREEWKVPENTEIMPYEVELANRLHFSGVQKEFWDASTQGLYFVGRKIKPLTIFDFRNC